jgi:FG-GAP-like repeat/IPT/TIG domain/Secretion system C-terminal sorting domain/FG-GAP repeat
MFRLYRSVLKSFHVLCFFLLLSIAVAAQPVISSFSPLSGPVGTVVTITGTGFNSTAINNLVFFGTIKATVSAATKTSITVTVPSGTSFEYISVINSFYTAYSSIPFLITFPGGSDGFNAYSFTAKNNFTISSNPYSVSTGDLDGDGKPDMVVANTGANTISIFLNSSTPGSVSFAPKIDLVTGKSPHRICIADISGDGIPEILVTNYDDGSVSIFRNNSTPGSLSFSAKTDIATGANPESLAVGDLDGNGTADLVVTNSGASSITIFTNKASSGGGTDYSNPTTIGYGGSPMGVTLGDLDGDGKPDIIVSNIMSNNLSVFRNTGGGGILSFALNIDYPAFLSPQQISVADLDGDGKPELVAGGNQTISISKNNSTPGNISFSPAVSTGSVADVFTAIADLDGDGKPDIAAAAQFSNAAYVLKNESTVGNILLDNSQFYGVGNNPTDIAIADFDGDGKPDLVLSNITDGSVSVLRNKTNEPYIISYTTSGGCPANGVILYIHGGKFTNALSVKIDDSASQFYILSDSVIQVTLQGTFTKNISISNAYGTDSFQVPPPVINSFSPETASPGMNINIYGKYLCGVSSVRLGSVLCSAFTVNSDSSISAIVGYGASGSLSLTGPGGVDSLSGFIFIPLPVISNFTPGSGPVGTVVTINGKGFSPQSFDDIVYFGAVRATVITASDTMVTVSVPTGASYQPISLTNAEHNLTGYAAQPFIVRFGTGQLLDTGFFHINTAVAQTGQFPLVSIINDMDLDGLPDLITADFASGSSSVIRNTSLNKNLSFAAKNTFFVGNANSQTRSVITADFDGDGKNDLAVMNEMDTNITILKNAGSPGNIVFQTVLTMHAGYESSPSNSAISDLDGDGKPDLIVLNDQYGRPSIFRNISIRDTIIFATPISLVGSSRPGSIVVTDFDGDGKPDIAITNGGGIYVYLNKSIPGMLAFAPQVFFSGGFGTTGITAGDLDGDKLPDIVFSNPGNGNFSIIRNQSTPGNISFGPKMDINLSPFPTESVPADNIAISDVDGDGMADICVTTETDVRVFKNISTTGNISLATPVAFAMPYGYNGNYISIDDMNSDGKPDLAVISQNSTNVTVFINMSDSSAPFISGFLPASARYGDTVFISGSHFAGSTAVSFAGIPAVSFQVISDSLIEAIVGKGATGNIDVTSVKGTASAPGFTYESVVIKSFSPAAGGTGTVITIYGRYFSNVTGIQFGGTDASSFIIISDSVITAVVGSGSTGSVTAVSADGQSQLAGFTFVSANTPTVTSFYPLKGSSGTLITIYGKNLSGVSAVSFGGVQAASFLLLDTVIIATVGQGASGAVSVTTTNGQDSLLGFTYINNNPTDSLSLHINSFTPASAAAGQIVLVKGLHFTGTTYVSFGGVIARSFTVLNDSSLQAIVGNGASGYLTVKGISGTDSLSAFIFLVPSVQAPLIQSFNPDSASIGATISIYGFHFNGTQNIRFGNTAAASFVVVSDSLITAVVGNGSSGNIWVETIAGVDSLSGFVFTESSPPPVNPPVIPTLQSFTPAIGNTGTIVYIYGTNFTNVTTVSFGGTVAGSFTIVSDSVIKAVVSNGSSGAITITSPVGTSSMDGFKYLSGLSINPNPATNFVTVHFPVSNSASQLTLVDYSGRNLVSMSLVPGNTSATVNISGASPGMYIFTWKNGSSTLSQSLMIK